MFMQARSSTSALAEQENTMDSLTKIKLKPQELADLTWFGLEQKLKSSREITDGWSNTIHALDLADGTQAVLKIAPPPHIPVLRYEQDILATEVAVLRIMGSQGLPVPQVLANLDTTPWFPQGCFFMELVPGQTWGKAKQEALEAIKTGKDEDGRIKAQLDTMDKDLGQLQARINNCSSTLPPASSVPWGPLHWKSQAPATWYEAVLRMVRDLLQDAQDKDVPLPAADNEILGLYESRKDILDQVQKPALVLWDLHDGNLMYHQGRITGILDCDRSLWGDPLMEFWFRSIAGASPAFCTAYARTVNPEIFPQALSLAGQADPGLVERIRLYDLYLALIMRIECAFRDYSPGHTSWTASNLASTLDALKSPV